MVQGFHFRYSKQLNLYASIRLITKQKNSGTWLQDNSKKGTRYFKLHKRFTLFRLSRENFNLPISFFYIFE